MASIDHYYEVWAQHGLTPTGHDIVWETQGQTFTRAISLDFYFEEDWQATAAQMLL